MNAVLELQDRDIKEILKSLGIDLDPWTPVKSHIKLICPGGIEILLSYWGENGKWNVVSLFTDITSVYKND